MTRFFTNSTSYGDKLPESGHSVVYLELFVDWYAQMAREDEITVQVVPATASQKAMPIEQSGRVDKQGKP